tara:strand:- start:110 stop:688 length:579 start_codon:yes stop_codon:yes gene_type:complete
MKLKQLKEIIDKEYNINIADRNRERDYSYARKVYCKLAREMGFTLQATGELVGIKHDAAYYHTRTFNTIEPKDLKIYKKVRRFYKDPTVIDLETATSIHRAEKKKYEAKITELLITIDKLKTRTASTYKQKLVNDTLDIFIEWDDKTLKEFIDTRLNIFNKSLENRVVPKTITEVKGALIKTKVNNPVLSYN